MDSPDPYTQEIIWAIAVDSDGEPFGKAHQMKWTENPPDEVFNRRPICGQVFREGWMQIPMEGHEDFCKKCVHITQLEIIRLEKKLGFTT